MTTKVWSPIQPTGDAYAFEPGERYAVLASVSLNYTLSQIQAKAESEGFQVTYAWETGQASRDTYAIDQWLASLPADTTSNHRWVYAEGNFSGSTPWSLSVDPPWPFTIYHVEYVFQAVEGTPDQPPTPLPHVTPPPASSGLGWVVPAVAVVVLALVGIGYAGNVRTLEPWQWGHS